MKPRSSKINKKQANPASQSTSRQSALGSLLLRAMGVGVGTIVCVMVLQAASGQDEDRAGANRKKIESMTSAERAQLKRNYEKFQNLSSQEKQRLRKIHTATRDQPKLNHLMRSYCDWVKTLSPWEQEDLRKAKTPQDRMKLIHKFRSQGNALKRRRSRFDSDILGLIGINPRDPHMTFFWISSPPSDLYNKVIGLLERSLPHPVKSTKPKDSLSELQHTLAVLKLVSAQKDGDENSASWLSSEVMKNMDQLLVEHDYSFRYFGEQRVGNQHNRDVIRQRRHLVSFLAKGLVNQLINTVKQELEKQSPSDEELQKFFESEVETKVKDYLMKYPPDDMQEKLKNLYLKQNLPQDVRKKIKAQALEVKDVSSQLFRGLDLRGPGGESMRKGGNRGDRIQDMRNRRFNSPRGGGDRPGRDQKTEQRPLRKPPKRSGA